MNHRLRASIAQIVASLVAHRTTPQDEIPALVQCVHLALSRIERNLEPDREAAVIPPVPARRERSPRPLRVAAATPVIEPAILPPRLLRRADVVPAALHEEASLFRPVSGGMVRGVVRWFDQRTRRGALRLPGLSVDVGIETALLDEMSISRLYKGQEVEATLSEEGIPRVVRLAVPGGASQHHSIGGFVRGRHAKPVVVELKREALRRVAARAEAETLLGRGRNR